MRAWLWACCRRPPERDRAAPLDLLAVEPELLDFARVLADFERDALDFERDPPPAFDDERELDDLAREPLERAPPDFDPPDFDPPDLRCLLRPSAISCSPLRKPVVSGTISCRTTR